VCADRAEEAVVAHPPSGVAGKEQVAVQIEADPIGVPERKRTHGLLVARDRRSNQHDVRLRPARRPEDDLPAQVRAHLGEFVISMKSSADAP